MRNDFGNRPYKPRFPYSSTEKKQGYNDRLDESLGERNGKKSQSFKDRRVESRGAKKST